MARVTKVMDSNTQRLTKGERSRRRDTHSGRAKTRYHVTIYVHVTGRAVHSVIISFTSPASDLKLEVDSHPL